MSKPVTVVRYAPRNECPGAVRPARGVDRTFRGGPIVDDATPTSKRCRVCGETKPLDAFYRDARRKDGRRSDCKACALARVKAWEAANQETRRERQRAEYRRNRERYRATRRHGHLRRTYGLTAEQYDAMLAAQGGVCAMCGEAPTLAARARYFPVDHDHETGAPRAILCNRCNVALGYVEDPVLMENAAAYLAKFEEGGGRNFEARNH